MINVKQHKRKCKNKVSIVRKHSKRGNTHKVVGGKRYVFVDSSWKHDDFPNTPKKGWSYEKLVKEKLMYQNELNKGLAGNDILPQRKLGLLTRRIRKITRFLKSKSPNI